MSPETAQHLRAGPLHGNDSRHTLRAAWAAHEQLCRLSGAASIACPRGDRASPTDPSTDAPGPEREAKGRHPPGDGSGRRGADGEGGETGGPRGGKESDGAVTGGSRAGRGQLSEGLRRTAIVAESRRILEGLQAQFLSRACGQVDAALRHEAQAAGPAAARVSRVAAALKAHVGAVDVVRAMSPADGRRLEAIALQQMNSALATAAREAAVPLSSFAVELSAALAPHSPLPASRSASDSGDAPRLTREEALAALTSGSVPALFCGMLASVIPLMATCLSSASAAFGWEPASASATRSHAGASSAGASRAGASGGAPEAAGVGEGRVRSSDAAVEALLRGMDVAMTEPARAAIEADVSMGPGLVGALQAYVFAAPAVVSASLPGAQAGDVPAEAVRECLERCLSAVAMSVEARMQAQEAAISRPALPRNAKSIHVLASSLALPQVRASLYDVLQQPGVVASPLGSGAIAVPVESMT